MAPSSARPCLDDLMLSRLLLPRQVSVNGYRVGNDYLMFSVCIAHSVSKKRVSGCDYDPRIRSRDSWARKSCLPPAHNPG